jgi:hypothetical protein
MSAYRKRPVIIEATQYTGDNAAELIGIIGPERCTCSQEGQLQIHTLEGIMAADRGDYIIRGVQGEYYPCKPDIFRQTYEKVNDTQRDIPLRRCCRNCEYDAAGRCTYFDEILKDDSPCGHWANEGTAYLEERTPDPITLAICNDQYTLTIGEAQRIAAALEACIRALQGAR